MGARERDFVQIEDLKIGDGPVAAWGRKISAQVRITQADGTFIFDGPMVDLIGFKGMPEAGLYAPQLVPPIQPGIRLGLNGMAIGGKRRITVDRKLVCEGMPDNAPPEAKCPVIGPGNSGPRYDVLKQKLIVEATLTESCIPVRLWAFVWVSTSTRKSTAELWPNPNWIPPLPFGGTIIDGNPIRCHFSHRVWTAVA